MNDMRYRIPLKRLIKLFAIIYVVVAAIIFVSFMSFFLQKWDISQPIVLVIYTLIIIAIFLMSYCFYFYEIGKRSILVTKFTKKIEYFYKDILYIDESKGEKTKVITFVTSKGHVIYLNNDKEGKVYQALITKCDRLISYPEIKDKFPQIKL